MLLKKINLILVDKKKFFILKRSTTNSTTVVVRAGAWRVPSNRVETINDLSQRWDPPMAPEAFRTDPEDHYTAMQLVRGSDNLTRRTHVLLDTEINSGGFRSSFIGGHLRTNFPRHSLIFRSRDHVCRHTNLYYNMNNRRNDSVEILPAVFNLGLSSHTEGGLVVGFQSISHYLQKLVSNSVAIVEHRQYSDNALFEEGKEVGMRCLDRAYVVNTPQSSEYIRFLTLQNEISSFLFTKLRSYFTLSHFMLLMTLIDSYTHIGGALLGYSLQPFLLAFLGPTDFFPLYKFLYERDNNGNYVLVETLKSVLRSLETNLFPYMSSQILKWIKGYELNNPITNCLVYYLTTYRTQEASGVMYVSISQGVSTRTFLSFETIVVLSKFFPYKPKSFSFVLGKKPSSEVCEGPTPLADEYIPYEDLYNTIEFFLNSI